MVVVVGRRVRLLSCSALTRLGNHRGLALHQHSKLGCSASTAITDEVNAMVALRFLFHPVPTTTQPYPMRRLRHRLFAQNLNSSTLQLLTHFGQAHWDVARMRSHIIYCLRRGTFTEFPRASNTHKILNPLKPLVYCITSRSGQLDLVSAAGQRPTTLR